MRGEHEPPPQGRRWRGALRCRDRGLQPPPHFTPTLFPWGTGSQGTRAPSCKLERTQASWACPPPRLLTQLPPLAPDGEELLPQQLHVQVQPAGSFACQGGDAEGLVGAEGSHVVGRRGPPSAPSLPTPGQWPCRAPTRGDPAGHGGFLKPRAAQLLIQIFQELGMGEEPVSHRRGEGMNGTPCLGWETRQPRGQQAPGLGQRDRGGTPYPGFHQQLPCDGEHGGEAEGGAHCGGKRG